MADFSYYNALIAGINDETVKVNRIVHGISWTAAVLSDGRTGVAMHTEGETFPRMFGNICGMPAAEAAQAALSWNMEEANEGMAVINAWYNTPENRIALGAGSEPGTLQGENIEGLTIGFVGHLVGHGDITEEVLAPAKKYYVLEREPKPGDMPDSACEYVLPECDLVVITGSAAMNKTLPRLLELSAGASRGVILTGPSVTLCPAALDFGIRKLYGRVITEPEAMIEKIVEKRTSVNAFSLPFTLKK